MKKLLLISLFCLGAFTAAQAQGWLSQATSFPVTSTGITDMSAVDTNIVWAVAYDGSGNGNNFINFSRTTNGGTLWTAGTVGTDTTMQFCNISALNDTEAWVCMYNQVIGHSGGLWKTANAGVTWTQAAVGLMFTDTVNSFPNFVHFKDPLQGIVVGDPAPNFYEIYHTGDGGLTWIPVDSANIPLPNNSDEFAIANNFEVFDDEIWFGTNHGRVFRSLDYGHHWTVDTVNPSAGASGTIFSLAFRNHDVGLCTRSVGTTPNFVYTLYRTVDGGDTWTNIPTPAGWFKQNTAWIPGTFTFMSSSQDVTPLTDAGSSYSLDDGTTWTIVVDSIQFGELEFVSPTTGWSGDFTTDAITDGVYKWIGAGTPLATNEPMVKAETVTAYPNPATNGIIHLDLIVEKRSTMNVSMTDALGRLVYSRVLNAGSGIFKHNIDVSQLTPGIYFISLEHNGNRSVKRIVIQ